MSGSKRFFKHCLLFSLYVRKCTTHAWEGERYNSISCLSPFFTLETRWIPPWGQVGVSSSCKGFLFGLWWGGVGSVMTSHCDPCLLAAGRRQHLCTRHKVARNSPLSSGLRALQTERAIAVLSLQLSEHRPPSPRSVCLRLALAWSVIWALRNCWHRNSLARQSHPW